MNASQIRAALSGPCLIQTGNGSATVTPLAPVKPNAELVWEMVGGKVQFHYAKADK